MPKLTEEKLQQKIQHHKKKVDGYQKKLNELRSPVIGFAYKNRNK